MKEMYDKNFEKDILKTKERGDRVEVRKTRK